MKERADLADLLESDKRQWKQVGTELEAIRKQFGQHTVLGARRTQFAEAGEGLHQASLIYLGLVLFLITFIVLSMSKLLLAQLKKGEGARS